jgi:hypothetical protein
MPPLSGGSNTRINPPGDNCGKDKFSMRGPLIPVGFNELFGCAR